MFTGSSGIMFTGSSGTTFTGSSETMLTGSSGYLVNFLSSNPSKTDFFVGLPQQLGKT